MASAGTDENLIKFYKESDLDETSISARWHARLLNPVAQNLWV